jgi:hypothetical protein
MALEPVVRRGSVGIRRTRRCVCPCGGWSRWCISSHYFAYFFYPGPTVSSRFGRSELVCSVSWLLRPIRASFYSSEKTQDFSCIGIYIEVICSQFGSLSSLNQTFTSQNKAEKPRGSLMPLITVKKCRDAEKHYGEAERRRVVCCQRCLAERTWYVAGQ